MFVKGLVSAVATIVFAAVSSPAASQPAATGNGVVLMRDGDVFLGTTAEQPVGCIAPMMQWNPVGNIFSASGRAPSTVIGYTTNSQIVTSNGDWLVLQSAGPLVVWFYGNLFALTGTTPAPGEEFTTAGGGLGDQFAVTNLGSVFRWLPCNGGHWTFVGALPIGPTGATRETWGKLKIRYR